MRWAVSPKLLQNPETAGLGLATARQCVNLFLATGTLAGLGVAFGLYRVAALLCAAAGFSLLVLVIVRFASNLALIRFIGAVGLLGFPLGIAWTARVLMPAALSWLVLLPLIGTLIDGARVGTFFGALAVLALVTATVGDALGMIPESTLPASATFVFTSVALVALVIVVVAVTAHYASTRTEALERLASAERDLARTREQALLAERLASLGTLAAGVAHEINNPMAFVAGNVESVLRRLKAASRGELGLDLPECEAALSEALIGAGRVRDIVSDLRTFAHTPDESLRSVDAAHLISAVTRIVHNELRHRAELAIDVTAGLVVSGSESRLAQVLVNLLTNAVQAMPDRPLAENRIMLRARALSADLAEIEVSDNGVGMSAEVLTRTLEPFFTTKAVGVGTGLGLYVCRNLVAAMKGRLLISSQPGMGTRVTIELGRATAPAAIPSLPRTLPPPRPARRRVLVVDDEPLVRRAISRMLSGRSDVVTASSVEHALAAVKSEHFDVILCDVMMPGRGGTEFLRELETSDARLAARVGFITGGAFDSGSRELLAVAHDRWIAKPCDTGELESLIERLAIR
jgi:two-component system NtrC family sensor kinase